MKPNALILATVWPEPESSAAGWRSWNVIDAFREAGWAVTVGSPSRENRFSERLRAEGIETCPTALNDPSFDEWIAGRRFDAAVLDRFMTEEQFGWRIHERSPGTLRILDTVDLHFLRRARQAALEGGATLEEIFDDRIDLLTEDACREIASIYRSDLSLILSDHEMELLTGRFGVDEGLLLSFPFCYRELSPEPAPGFSERSHFVSIGNFRHPPNADAVLWLKSEIWPRIRAEAGADSAAELHVYGSYPSREIMALSSASERFFVKGPADSAHETLRRYRVSLAPLRFGAGIKGKISDSWHAGTPVVTTPIGAEGMIAGEGSGIFGGLIAREAGQFARQAALLYSDQVRWQAAQNDGWRVIRERFDFALNSREFMQRIEEARASLAGRRRANFTGMMLSHHSLRSTKYFSKWVELVEAGKARNAY